MNYLVSVIIPVYNCEKYLERAIESVVCQSLFSECELILVDDGSADNSPAICDRYSEKYDNISVIHQQNAGVSVARNNGIKASTGEWICFLDSDDYLLPDALSLTHNYPDSDIICSEYASNSDVLTDYLEYISYGTFKSDEIREVLVKLLANYQCFYACWSKFFKRAVLIDNNIHFPVGRKLAEDMVFVYSYLTCCKTISFSDKKIYYYFVNDCNTTNVVPKSFDTVRFIYDWKTEYFKTNGWYSDTIKNNLIKLFVWQSFLSFKSAAFYLGFFSSIKYLKQCFNDSTFHKYYLLIDYKSFETFFDRVLDWSIRRKNPIPFCFLSKLNYLKSKVFDKFLR